MRTLKKLTGAFLALALAVGPLAVPAAAVTYEDTQGHWASAAIEKWSGYGVLQGSGGQFRPDAPITRGELAAVLQRVMGYSAQAANTFTDLDPAAWYTPYVLSAAAAGVMKGSDRQIRPTANITREEAVVMMARAFDLNTATAVLDYTDAAAISPWAMDAVTTMSALGYIQGSDGAFSPQAPLTRASAVTILNNMIGAYYNTAGVYRSDADGLAVIAAPGVTLLSMTVRGDLLIAPGASGGDTTLADVTVTGSTYNDSGRTPIVLDAAGAAEVNRSANLSFAAAAGGTFGVDVSAHQKTIDWSAAAADGVGFAMIRLGYRGYAAGTLLTDPFFEANLTGAQGAGLDTGVYLYSAAVTVEEAQEEAQLVLDALNGRSLSYPVVFDWEVANATARNANVDKATVTAMANAFCTMIKDAGYTPAVYFNQEHMTQYFDLSALGEWEVWFAQYRAALAGDLGVAPTLWQYTSSGTVAGIEGKVDLDVSFRGSKAGLD